MTPEMKIVLSVLDKALIAASESGLLDEMQGHCNSPDSINDVCDACQWMVSEMLHPKESQPAES